MIRNFPRRASLPQRDDLEATAARIAARQRAARSLPPAPAKFIGVQHCWGLTPDIELFNMTATVGELIEGSTVSRDTLEKAGFFVPAILPARNNQGSADSHYGRFTA